jgi:cyclopropane fatty-acyl-phospholipid synthase-like methyltransferase
MMGKPNAPASGRNRQPILEVLEIEFRDCGSVLEIGSGTGQHAVFFAEAMPRLTWQTSDLAENHAGIRSWIADAGLPNVRDPILLDVQQVKGVNGEYDGLLSANTAHIMSMPAVRCMFDVARRLLSVDGVFCLYGPFNEDGEFSSASNKNFDRSLRSPDRVMGIRNLEDLDDFADESMMHRDRLYAMPANNLLAVWRKRGMQKEYDDS